jgi:hypothetical protein
VTGAPVLVAATLCLGAGTLALRITGGLLRSHVELSERVDALLAQGAAVLMVATVATAALLDGREPAGVARIAGVAVAGVLAWQRAAVVVVVLGAAGTAAVLWMLGWAA